jgi:hypothetical protein
VSSGNELHLLCEGTRAATARDVLWQNISEADYAFLRKIIYLGGDLILLRYGFLRFTIAARNSVGDFPANFLNTRLNCERD